MLKPFFVIFGMMWLLLAAGGFFLGGGYGLDRARCRALEAELVSEIKNLDSIVTLPLRVIALIGFILPLSRPFLTALIGFALIAAFIDG
ncbi:hypothetical protein [Variovorax saccharolyticus]|uniref:hypothetical protein n=1 Tax=Variovorax saccharolyticus TaxID=3053516 RepID=UPI0025753162|nr:hypothetical protein [Variovorax sp. J31P216]MDM0029987.1 hypothetical protein [Variovorax sp. J31P216]